MGKEPALDWCRQGSDAGHSLCCGGRRPESCEFPGRQPLASSSRGGVCPVPRLVRYVCRSWAISSTWRGAKASQGHLRYLETWGRPGALGSALAPRPPRCPCTAPATSAGLLRGATQPVLQGGLAPPAWGGERVQGPYPGALEEQVPVPHGEAEGAALRHPEGRDAAVAEAVEGLSLPGLVQRHSLGPDAQP